MPGGLVAIHHGLRGPEPLSRDACASRPAIGRGGARHRTRRCRRDAGGGHRVGDERPRDRGLREHAGPLEAQRRTRTGEPPLRPRARRLRAGRGRRCARARGRRTRAGARRDDPRPARRLRGRRATPPTWPRPTSRAAAPSAACAPPWPTPTSRPRTSATSTPTRRARRPATRSRRARIRTVFGNHADAVAGLGDQGDDRAPARRGRRTSRRSSRSARARGPAAPAHDQSRRPRPRVFARSRRGQGAPGRGSQVAISNSFGFGGVNAALVLRTMGEVMGDPICLAGDHRGLRAEAARSPSGSKRPATRCATSARRR